MFITLEGIDGSGKSSIHEKLVQRLRAEGVPVTVTREIGGTQLAEDLRKMVLGSPMDAETECLLAFAARRDHLLRVIAPALHNGHTVVCDRFVDSTFAYQGAGRGVDWGFLEVLERRMLANCHPHRPGRITPDMTLWFDVPPDVAARRIAAARASSSDRFEGEDLAFFERVRFGYLRRQQQDPQRFVRIDASQAPELVWEDVWRAVRVPETAVRAYAGPLPAVHSEWRHRNGTIYAICGHSCLQATGSPLDGEEMVTYRGVDDGSIWTRPLAEFMDGRFEPMPRHAARDRMAQTADAVAEAAPQERPHP